MIIRKNQKDLTAAEWTQFVSAFQRVTRGFLQNTGKPTLDDFADEHAKAFGNKFMHLWGAHTHLVNGVVEHAGLYFLAWHRVFLHEFESRLRREQPDVTLPYWNAVQDALPDEIKRISANEGETVPIGTDDVTGWSFPDFSQTNFEDFQLNLELVYHNPIHVVLGGKVAGGHAPKDVAFWLHHAFVDRQWGHWYEKHNGTLPSTMSNPILGDKIVKGKRVQDVVHTTQIDSGYDNGIVSSTDRNGRTSGSVLLRKGQILTVKLPGGDFYAKIFVWSVAGSAATLVLKLYPQRLPGEKLIMIIPETMFYRVDTSRIRVPAGEGHLRFTVTPSQAGNMAYSVSPVNGVALAEFTEITDFTGNAGGGSTDFDMLSI